MAEVKYDDDLNAEHPQPARASRAEGSVHGPIFHARAFTELGSAEENYLAFRHSVVRQHFPQAYGVDDFLARAEIELCKYGFTGETSIAMLNLCRDEITNSFKKKIETIFGTPFNTHGLGGVLTCGVTGMKAGLSHSPVANPWSRERYIFLSFPHIAINASGEVGKISRAARPNSHACGALLKLLSDFKLEDPLEGKDKVGKSEVHDALDPEFSILKHRLEQHICKRQVPQDELDLVRLTNIAEEACSEDLEQLISHSVDVTKADYAVVTGIQIHNWANTFEDEQPNLEFIQPCRMYVVMEGVKTEVDIHKVSALTPRQIRLLAMGSSMATPSFHSLNPIHPGLDYTDGDGSVPRSKASVSNEKGKEQRYALLAAEKQFARAGV